MSLDQIIEMPLELPTDSKNHRFIEIELETLNGIEHYMVFDSQFENAVFHKDLIVKFLYSKGIMTYPKEYTKRDRNRFVETRPMVRMIGTYHVKSMGFAHYDAKKKVLTVSGKSEEYDFSPNYLSLKKLVDSQNSGLPEQEKITLIDKSIKGKVDSLPYILSSAITGMNLNNGASHLYE